MSNLKKICRICTFGLLHTKETRQKFYEIFEECDLLKGIEELPNPTPYLIIKQFFNSNFQIGKDDGLPNVICPNCIERFSEMYELFKTCEKSQRVLQKKFNPKLEHDVQETFTDVPFIELPNIDIKDEIIFDGMDDSPDSDNDKINFNEIEDSVMDVVATEDFALNQLPEKSRKKYQTTYDKFMDWKKLKNVDEISQEILLEYFEKLSQQYKSPSLWSIYSMLKSVLSKNNNIDIGTYKELLVFLKCKAENYRPLEFPTFSPQQISDFINKAPDENYLATKVAFIIGIICSCRLHQLRKMKLSDLKDLGSVLLVNVHDAKSKIDKRFTITHQFYEICKKYIKLRPPNCTSPYFFLNYQKGNCSQQVIGKNKFGSMGQIIASFLNLKNPHLYTGHSFKRTSANIFINSQGQVITLKRPGWRNK